YEHLSRAIEFSLTQLGPHGLCMGLAADWNDCLNLKGRGETIFSTFLLLRAIRELLIVLDVFPSASVDHGADVLKLSEARDRVLASIAESGWDGEWFLRGYVDSGRKIGSKESSGSTIFLNAQSWAVLSEAADKERLLQAMDSLHEHLAT